MYQLAAQDDEGDAVGFALVSGPTGLTVSPSGLVHWTPDEGQAGEHTVVLEAIDALGAASQQTYNLLVACITLKAFPRHRRRKYQLHSVKEGMESLGSTKPLKKGWTRKGV